jgi:hypothetical protein
MEAVGRLNKQLRPGMTRSLGARLEGPKLLFRFHLHLLRFQAPSSPKLRFFASTQTYSDCYLVPYLANEKFGVIFTLHNTHLALLLVQALGYCLRGPDVTRLHLASEISERL